MNKNTKDKVIREFKLTTLSLKNRNTIFLMIILLAVAGISSYINSQKELFPEIYYPTIFVKTIYPGNTPVDIENLITRPLEKEIQTINGIKELRSTSTQDNSDIFVEFKTGIVIKEALQDVKDAVDKAKSELPDDLDIDPIVMDLDFNEFPIININLSGDYSKTELKGFAEYLEDEIETISEISKVELRGLDKREIQINIDIHKLESFELNFNDIENAIAFENVSISGGDLKIDKTTRSIRTIGEFTNIKEIEDIIVKHEKGNIVYLKDVARVIDGYEDPLTIARLDRQAVVSLQVIKKSGENLLSATDKILNILTLAKNSKILPENLKITISNDQSEYVRDMLHNLENNIIMGIIFVIMVLFFFLGFRNALFVGIAIPMSMFISFSVLSLLGSTINMMVLFGLVLALGMLVDNAIVVVENIYRFIQRGYSLFNAAKLAVGEISLAIIASTATTLAAFFPLVFWPGIMGEFMKHLPITLIIVLTSSLFVALIIIPVLASTFIKKDIEKKKTNKKRAFITVVIMLVISVLFYISNIPLFGSLLIIFSILILLNLFVLANAANWFQNTFLVKLESFYLKILKFILRGPRPTITIICTFLLLFLTIVFFIVRRTNILLFPENEPTYINVIAELPIGSDITATDTFMKKLEEEIFILVEPYEKNIKSILTTIGQGVIGQDDFPIGNTPNKGMITISFVDYEDRKGIRTSEVMKEISNNILGKYPGIQFTIEKNRMGPPTGKPINIEISGKDFNKLLFLTDSIEQVIDKENIEGIEGLKIDLDVGMPELLININRERARRFGLSTAQIASTIRTALFGKEISDYKEGEDEYPIQLRLDKKYRNTISSLMNQKITFRSQSTGKIMQVPISSVADFTYSTTYGAVKRIDMNRVITLYSNVIEGYNPTKINNMLKSLLADFDLPEAYSLNFTGEQQEQDETMAFLTKALIIAIALILIILVTQFNSFIKPLIIIASVLLSTIGVFGGLATFNIDFILVMTGLGIISLAGIVVNNAIVLIDYIDFLKLKKKKETGIKVYEDLPIESSIECIILAGKTRLRPVLLTAITTILGLLPMASGLNIDFNGLLINFSPNIYFGGDNADFWGPMAWTIIFGLTFATVLTLIVVPAMYLMGNKAKLAGIRFFSKS